MARKGYTLTTSVLFDGKQAKNEMKAMERSADLLKEKIDGLQESMKTMEPDTSGFKKANRDLKDYQQQLATTETLIKSGVQKMQTYEDVLNNLSGTSLRMLATARNQLRNIMRGTTNEEDLKKQMKAFDTLTGRINELKAGYTDALKAAKEGGEMTVAEMQRLKSILTEMQSSTAQNTAEWKEYEDVIQQLNASLTTMTKVQHVIDNIGTASESSLSAAAKALEEMIENAEKGSTAMAEYEQQLKKVHQEEEARASAKAGKVMGKLQDYSVDEIKEAIKATEQLRDAQRAGSNEWDIYNDEIVKANEYLRQFTTLNKMVEVEGKMQNIRSISTDALSEVKKYWQEMVNGAERGSQELRDYESQLLKVRQEEAARESDQATKVLTNKYFYSVTEIQDAIKTTERLRDAQVRGSSAWANYNVLIEKARTHLQSFSDTEKRSDMVYRMTKLSSLSAEGISEVKKYWQEMVDGAGLGTQELIDYQKELQKVIEEEKRRKSLQAQEVLSKTATGTFDGTIEQTKEAIALLTKYRATLKTTDTTGLENVDLALASLNQKLKETDEGFLSLNDAIIKADEASQESFKGSIEDLEKLRKTLQEYQKQADVSDPAVMKNLEEAISKVDNKIIQAKNSTIDLDKVLKNVKSQSLEDLEKAAELLEEQLRKTAKNADDYNKTAADLRKVNAQIKEIKDSWQEHDNVLMKTVKRLTSYVLVYAGFNEVLGRLRELITANLELSDSMADIRKTTGLTEKQVAELGNRIDEIDTRTAQKELYDLAAAAGQIGLKSQEDILGFVKGANMVTVALNELGTEGTTSLMKIATLTGDIKKMGVEKALQAVGSSINELSANSAATAGPIVDFLNRVGSIGAQSGITMSEMAAMGATADALGQSMEVAGTSMGKFINTLVTKTSDVAYATGVDQTYLKGLIDQGKTMEAILTVLKAMNKMGGMEKLAPIMGELGSEGERMTRMLSTMAGGWEMLRDQVELSNTAFNEATSIQDEYNVKNENAIAILQRIGNTIRETFVNSGLVGILKSIVSTMYDVVLWMKRGDESFIAVSSAVIGLTTALVANRIAWIKNLNAFGMMNSLKLAALGIANFAKSLFTATTYTTGLTSVWNKLKVALSTHWLTALLTVLTAVGYAVYKFATYVSDAAKASGEFSASLQKEQMQVDALFAGLSKSNTEYSERIRLIKQINEQYSGYLGFMLSEKDSAEKLAAAHELINGKIRQRLALQLQEKMTEKAQERYSEQLSKALTGISQGFQEAPGITEVREQEASRMVQKIVQSNISKPMEEILLLVRQELAKKFDTRKASYGTAAYFDIQGNLKDLISARKKFQTEMDNSTKYAQEELNAANQEILEGGRKTLNALADEYTKLSQVDTSKYTSEQVEKHNEQMIKLLKDYLASSKNLVQYESGENLKNLQKATEAYRLELEKLSKVKAPNIWGEGLTLETADVNQLVAAFKKLETEGARMRADGNLKQLFGFEFDHRDDAVKYVYDQAKKIKERLAELGYTTSGKFLFKRTGGGGGKRGEQEEMKKEMTAALSALEAYFVMQETLIREKRVQQQSTEEEMNRQLERNEFAHLQARIKLRRDFLGEADGLTEMEKKQYGLEEKNIEQLSRFLLTKGQAMRDGIRLNLVKDELAMQEDLLRHQREIQKIILDNDFTGQVDEQYLRALDKLELFFAESEEHTEADGERRLTFMKQIASEAYLLNADALKKRMSQESEFSEWQKGKTEQDYQALLIMLQKYNDDYEAAENRAIERRKRIAEKKWEKSGQEDFWSAEEGRAEADVDMYRNAQSLGLASDSQVEDAQLKLYRLKVAASQAYLEQLSAEMQAEVSASAQRLALAQAEFEMKERHGVADDEDRAALLAAETSYQEAVRMQEQMTLDARTQLAERMKELGQQEMEIEKRKLETLKEYTDAIVDFSGQMGEAAFGEVKDRQEAAKQLLRTVMKLTKDLIMQKVIELTTKKTLSKAEVANEQATQAQITTIQGASAISGLTVEAAATTAETAAGIAKGSAKTIGKLGWWGIPLIAVISAALSALMGMALGKLNQAKSEVASATGASSGGRRMATGMLTYAEGDLPVLANDGKIYNARYQKELKTGVYGGGAHFGIFSEKKPEAIIDGDTTQRLILNYPKIWKSIVTLSRNGRIDRGMPAFASGNINTLAAGMTADGETPATDDTGMMQMQEALAANNAVMERLAAVLEKGISASVDRYTMRKEMNKANRFAESNKLK